MLQLREATTADAWLIADLSRQTFIDTFAADNDPEDMRIFLEAQFTRGRLALEVGAAGNTFFLAEEAGVVAGYVKVRPAPLPATTDHTDAERREGALEIARLYVLQSHIGSGLGARLMQHCLDQAAAQGLGWVWLGVWEHNQRALRFYRRWGFTVCGEQEFILGRDVQRDLIMKRRPQSTVGSPQ